MATKGTTTEGTVTTTKRTTTERTVTAAKRTTTERTTTTTKGTTGARPAAEGPATAAHRRLDKRYARHRNEHGRWNHGHRDGPRSHGSRSYGWWVHGVGRRHRCRHLDFRLRLRYRRRHGLGWGDDVFVGAGPQRNCRADAYRQRNLKRHNRADEDHRQRAACQQDGFAPLRTRPDR